MAKVLTQPINRESERASMKAAAVRHWYPLLALTQREVKKRYASTLFGGAWTVLQPLILLSIYVTVFGFVLRSGRTPGDSRSFVYYLLCGMLPYLAMSEGIQRSSLALREDRSLLDRADFPAEVIPGSRVLSASLTEIFGLILLLVLKPVFGMPLGAWITVLPLLVAMRLLLTCGLAWIVSILSVFIADLAEVLSLILTAWLFLTPIFYSAGDLPPALQRVIVLNPLYHLVNAYRSVLIGGRAPAPQAIWLLGFAITLAGAGGWFFRKALDRAKDLL